MSNIKPNPRFERTPGQPTASPPPDFYARYPCWNGHRNMAQIIAAEQPVECGKCRQIRATRCGFTACPLSSREAA